MPLLKILCDENIPYAVVLFLEKRRFLVERVKPGSRDADIVSHARLKRQIILTFDGDFANILLYPPQKYFGIVVIRISPPLTQTIYQSLENLFSAFKTTKDFKGKLITLESHRMRLWEKES
ncbi:MAG: DUF5615 family PIN-like protein [Candidatus Portnoybacteria bacterium]|nr:DUF5615 family PIN-like protein [Candidatus Portnoybacteria bacterium]